MHFLFKFNTMLRKVAGMLGKGDSESIDIFII